MSSEENGAGDHVEPGPSLDDVRGMLAWERYTAAMHAVQSGVKATIERGLSDESEPKHLRTGVNAAMVGEAALTSLLIKKGVFTKTEHLEELAEFAEAEKVSYEEKLSKALGTKVTLG